MNLFSALEGRKGENLITAVFRLLLLRSEPMRDTFIRLVSDNCRLGPITLGEQFACLIEQATDDQAGGSGRVDLIIETADAVIGVENKLFAGFQQGQPEKYLESLKQRAGELQKLRRAKSYLYLVVILAPKRRTKEIATRIANNRNCAVFDWEQLLDEFEKTSDDLDPSTAVIFESFNDFISERIALMPEFERWIPHLKGQFDPMARPCSAKSFRSFGISSRMLGRGLVMARRGSDTTLVAVWKRIAAGTDSYPAQRLTNLETMPPS